MNTRRAFTLLELLVAVVVAGIVALLVYGAAAAAADVQQKLSSQRDMRQSETAIREVMATALRNARRPSSSGDTAFILVNLTNALGRPGARLSFVAAGALPPLTPDADWALTLQTTAAGLVLSGAPLGFAAPARVLSHLPEITSLSARATPGPGQPWLTRWTDVTRLPFAVELTLLADTGVVGAPIHIVVPAGAPR